MVPAVRERMQRIRFLTAIAVGSLVTEGQEENPRFRDASPYLVWEWLIVEALIREKGDNPGIWGVPGTQVGYRALSQHGYLDARSYLKTPRIFGFNGVYKRLAVHLGLVDLHLSPGPNTERLVDRWARGLGFAGLRDAQPMIERWKASVRRSLAEEPPRTRPGWGRQGWTEIATAFIPSGAAGEEKRFLRESLLKATDRNLGALPLIWELQAEFDDKGFSEERLHNKLQESEPEYARLLEAIRTYERFARSLQDAFDLLRAEASRSSGHGFEITRIAHEPDFLRTIEGLTGLFERTNRTLSDVDLIGESTQDLFGNRFRAFSEPLDAGASALALCEHHESIQARKSDAGKRPWFDRLGQNRIHIRYGYREERRAIEPGRYLHDYRGQPIRRFYKDLS